MCIPAAEKYPLPQRWQTFHKQFLKALDLLTAYNRGEVFKFGRRSKHSINLDIARNSHLKICHLGGKEYFAADGSI